MRRFLGLFIALAMICPSTPNVNGAGLYSLSIETNPQTVDIMATSTIKIRLTRGSSPAPAIQIFLGLQGIRGKLRSEILATDKNGYASTEFLPASQGSGFVMAKATVSESGKVETIEAIAPITVKDLNMEPSSVVDQIFPLPGRISQPMTFRGHGVDPDGRISRWRWSMGDGKTYEGSGDSSQISHTYPLPGAYDVSFVVFDDRNAISTPVISRVTVVDNKLPEVKAIGQWPERAYVGDELEFGLQAVDAESQLVSLSMDYGDGTAERIDVTGGAVTHAFRHRYTKSGTFNVFVTATDRFGDGEPFPGSGWPVVVEGEAKGGLNLEIKGAIGKTIRLVGPLPLWNVAYEVTVGGEFVTTGQTLSEGFYHLLASDSSFGFSGIDGPIEIKAHNIEAVSTSVWMPTLALEPFVMSGKAFVNASLKDQDGNPLLLKSTLVSTAKDSEIEELTMTESGTALILLKPREKNVEVTVKARIGFVRCQSTKRLSFPSPLPSFRLIPQVSDGSFSVSMDSNTQISGQLDLTWTLVDRIEQKVTDPGIALQDHPSRFFATSMPALMPVRIKRIESGRYEVKLEAQVVFGGLRIADSCTFDPSAVLARFDIRWGILEDDSTGIEALAFNRYGEPSPNQQIFISYQFGQAVSWIPESVNFNSFPDRMTTDSTGCAYARFNLKRLLEGITVEDVRVSFRIPCSGVVHIKRIIIPPPKTHPHILAFVEESGADGTVRIRVVDGDGEIVKGCWLDMRYGTGDTRALGNPPSSIRSSTNGTAFFRTRLPEKAPVKLSIRATINGTPTMCILEIPAVKRR